MVLKVKRAVTLGGGGGGQKGTAGTFWGADNVLFLDLGAG